MRFITLFITLILCSTWASAQNNNEVIRLSEPVVETESFEVFGSEMEATYDEQLSSLTEAIESGEQEEELYVQTEIVQVCQKKGCFFVAQDEDFSARVTFIDYSFFIPTNSAGKTVVVRGTLNEKILSEEQARHYAEDEGKDPSGIIGEQKEYSIVATSVLIPKD
jgi:hypothetical protein